MQAKKWSRKRLCTFSATCSLGSFEVLGRLCSTPHGRAQRRRTVSKSCCRDRYRTRCTSFHVCLASVKDCLPLDCAHMLFVSVVAHTGCHGPCACDWPASSPSHALPQP